jgi:hypothetical protein
LIFGLNNNHVLWLSSVHIVLIGPSSLQPCKPT